MKSGAKAWFLVSLKSLAKKTGLKYPTLIFRWNKGVPLYSLMGDWRMFWDVLRGRVEL